MMRLIRNKEFPHFKKSVFLISLSLVICPQKHSSGQTFIWQNTLHHILVTHSQWWCKGVFHPISPLTSAFGVYLPTPVCMYVRLCVYVYMMRGCTHGAFCYYAFIILICFCVCLVGLLAVCVCVCVCVCV